MTTPAITVVLLADRPDLAAKWAELHWREWGDEPGREELSWWVSNAERHVQRTQVPVAFIAISDRDEVLGGVGLQQYDPVTLRDRSPWVVGTIVRSDQRGSGVGQALMAGLDHWATEAEIGQVWVVTGGRAVNFYQQCGYEPFETLPNEDDGVATVLTKRLKR